MDQGKGSPAIMCLPHAQQLQVKEPTSTAWFRMTGSARLMCCIQATAILVRCDAVWAITVAHERRPRVVGDDLLKMSLFPFSCHGSQDRGGKDNVL